MVRQYDVIDFVRNKFPYYEKYSDAEIDNIILQHIKYGTISILLDKEKVISLLRVNVSGNICDVCDLAVEDGYDFNKLVRQMTIELWGKFPYLKYFKFYRSLKYPLKKAKIYTIKRLLKVK